MVLPYHRAPWTRMGLNFATAQARIGSRRGETICHRRLHRRTTFVSRTNRSGAPRAEPIGRCAVDSSETQTGVNHAESDAEGDRLLLPPSPERAARDAAVAADGGQRFFLGRSPQA